MKELNKMTEKSKAPVPVLRCICVQCFSGRLFRFLWSCQDSLLLNVFRINL